MKACKISSYPRKQKRRLRYSILTKRVAKLMADVLLCESEEERLMRFGFQRIVSGAIGVVLLLVLCAIPTPAQKASRTRDAARHAGEASEVFNEVMNIKETAIPKELLDKAEAIA